MKIHLRSHDEPLRAALAFLVIALLLPLGVMIWLLQRGLETERSLARQELVSAYRQQYLSLAKERELAWEEFVEALPVEAPVCAEVLAWMDRGGIDAMLLIDSAGRLRFPPYAGLAPPGEPATASDAARLRALLHATEQTGPDTAERADLLQQWRAVFASRVPEGADLSLRERAFFAERLLRLAEAQEGFDPELRAALLIERHRFKLQEELVRFYHQQDWSLPDDTERWLYFMRPQKDHMEEFIFNYIRVIPDGVLVLQTRETAFSRWLASLWEGDAATSTVWLRLSSPSGAVVHDGATGGAEPFVTLDLPAPFYRWTLQLGFVDADYLARSSRQQTAFALYAGLAIVLLVLLAGALSVRQIGQQIRLNKLKNDFIGMVSHELRTPLASMRMLVDTLREGRYRDESTVRDYLGLIAGENERLSRLVENFLTFTRMQRGKNHFQMRPVEPRAVVDAAIAATRGHLEDPAVTFTAEAPPGLPEVMADPDALVTVVRNLLENAYKYTGDKKEIRLRLGVDGRALRIDVEDNGIGIPPREQKLIFREFYQVDNRLARRSEGSGLGLSINRHIVRAHGGRIEVRSQPGAGACFSVFIPLPA